MATVSIVMLSYNHAEFVRDAVESVLAQTFGDWELVIMENGSTDGSKALLEQYAAKDSRIKLHSHPDNQALTKRLNQGVRASTGRFIGLLMSDDLYLPTKLQQQVDGFAELDDSWGVLYSPGWHHNVITNQRWLSDDVRQSGRLLEPLLQALPDGFICPISPLYRRECLETYPFDEELFQEGEAINLRIAMRWRFFYQAEPTVIMRDHARNVGKAIRRNTECLETTLEKLQVHPEFPVEDRPLVTALLVRFHRAAAWQMLRVNGDARWARRMLLKAVRSDWRQALQPKTVIGMGLSLLPPPLLQRANRALSAVTRPVGNEAYVEDYR